jgi:hypothetical protein
VVHDFDRSGLNIASILKGRNTKRHKYTRSFKTYDLGLRLADVYKYGLEDKTEAVAEKKPMTTEALRKYLVRCDATKEEIDFLSKRVRVEMNAFTSPQLIQWLEDKLTDLGLKKVVKKVVPDLATIEKLYRDTLYLDYHAQAARNRDAEFRERADNQPLPEKVIAKIRKIQKNEPELLWDKPVIRLARGEVVEVDDDDLIEPETIDEEPELVDEYDDDDRLTDEDRARVERLRRFLEWEDEDEEG